MKPQRIQLSRKKGFNLQAVSLALNGLPAVVVSRPSQWGNPYPVAAFGAENAIWHYKKYIKEYKFEPRIQSELRGKNLACWCQPGQPCHADVLLKIANE